MCTVFVYLFQYTKLQLGYHCCPAYLATTVALPTCMHLSSCSHVHGNAYSVLRPMQFAGPAPPSDRHISALIVYVISQITLKSW